MLRFKRTRGMRDACGLKWSAGFLAFVALGIGGCSVDLERFGSGAGYAPDSGGPTSSLAPTPREPVYRNGAGLAASGDDYAAPRGGYDAPRGSSSTLGTESRGLYRGTRNDFSYGQQSSGYGSGGYNTPASQETRVAALPPPTQSAQSERWGSRPEGGARQQERTPQSAGYATQDSYGEPPQRAPAPSRVTPAGQAGNAIVVQQGDTLSSISRQYRVSISELMTLNNLQSPVLRPGQQLLLPSGKRAVAQRQPFSEPPRQQQAAISERGSESRATPASSGAAAHGEWQGTHTLAAGESLYGIARKYNVKVADLQRVNGIQNPHTLRPGLVLKVPGAGAGDRQVAAMSARPAASQERDAAVAPRSAGETPIVTVRPRIINATEGDAPAEPKRVASLGPNPKSVTDAVASDAAPKAEPASAAGEMPKLGGTGKFRWPVKGKVIAGFGARPDKSHNDGIDISVPQGTDVMAAENGVVAYAGNELKGYGNLVLIRHEGNWVSAYAHNDTLLVKRGDAVRRGQTIAKAGNTGSVDRPQVHFELRRDSKPVDPMPFMEKQ